MEDFGVVCVAECGVNVSAASNAVAETPLLWPCRRTARRRQAVRLFFRGAHLCLHGQECNLRSQRIDVIYEKGGSADLEVLERTVREDGWALWVRGRLILKMIRVP